MSKMKNHLTNAKKFIKEKVSKELIVTAMFAISTFTLGKVFQDYLIPIVTLSGIIQWIITDHFFYKESNRFLRIMFNLLKVVASSIAVIISVEEGISILILQFGVTFFLLNMVAFKTSGKNKVVWSLVALSWILLTEVALITIV